MKKQQIFCLTKENQSVEKSSSLEAKDDENKDNGEDLKSVSEKITTRNLAAHSNISRIMDHLSCSPLDFSKIMDH